MMSSTPCQQIQVELTGRGRVVTEVFIKNEIASGRYGSASEVVRDALRTLEERKSKLAALRSHLAEGAAQAERGEFVTLSLDEMLTQV